MRVRDAAVSVAERGPGADLFFSYQPLGLNVFQIEVEPRSTTLGLKTQRSTVKSRV